MMKEIDDDRLIDPDRWVDLHGDALYRFACARVRGKDQAVDLVQESFLHALRSRDTFAGNSSERTWLVGILRHKILDHYRRSARDRVGETSGSEFFDERGFWKPDLPSPVSEPSAELERREFWQGLESCRRSLPPGLLSAYTLRELDGMSSEAVCEALAISPANLWARLHRARLHLRACLARHGYGEKNR